MKSNELLQHVFKRHGAKRLTESQKLALATLYKWCHADAGKAAGNLNPLERIGLLVDATQDDSIAQWICERAGGFFVRNPTVKDCQPADLLCEENDVFANISSMLEEIAAAARDKRISREETRKIRSKWEHSKSVAEHFVLCCEQEDFDALRLATAQHLPSLTTKLKAGGATVSRGNNSALRAGA